MTVYIGVDIGTTSTKTIAYDKGGRLLAQGSARYVLSSPHPSWEEEDPEEIFEAVLGTLSRVVREVKKENHGEISGVSFSAAMHTLMGLDADGRPLTASITYADNRATEQATRLREATEGPAIHRRTGTPIHPMSPLTKLLWFRERDADTFNRAAKWVSIKEYVFYRLFGEYVVDYSIASATGLFNLENLDWDGGVLAMLRLPVEKLSRPVPTTHVVEGLKPEYAGRLGLDRGTPFVVGANDGVLGNLGLGATEPGEVACSIGTSGAVREVVSRPQVDDELRLFCYALTEDRWVIGGPINNGGIALQWTQDGLCPDLGAVAREQGRDPYDLMGEMAGGVPAGSEGLIFLPYLMGERAPHWNADVSAVFFGLTLQHRREHLIRAVMEGVIYQLHSVALALKDVTGEPREIRATGGFARSALWRQIMADVSQREVAFPDSYEGSCWGAALLGMKALGAINSLDVARQMTKISTRHRPDEHSARVYEELVKIFIRLYKRLEPEFAAISRFQRSV
jgi:gluconokinase